MGAQLLGTELTKQEVYILDSMMKGQAYELYKNILERLLAHFRELNDGDLSERETNQVRGKIAAIREIVDFSDEVASEVLILKAEDAKK